MQACVSLAMPHGAMIAFATLEFVSDNLGGFDFTFDDLAFNSGVGDKRTAYLDIIAVGDEEHIIERGGVSGF